MEIEPKETFIVDEASEDTQENSKFIPPLEVVLIAVILIILWGNALNIL